MTSKRKTAPEAPEEKTAAPAVPEETESPAAAEETAAFEETTAPEALEEKAASADPERRPVTIVGIKIASVGQHGFRRCGRHWPKEGTVVVPAELTEDELRTLHDEPHLALGAGTPIELGAVTLDELRGWAKIQGIDLGKADTVDAIVKRLALPKPSAPSAEGSKE